jgi:hypothetical protein
MASNPALRRIRRYRDTTLIEPAADRQCLRGSESLQLTRWASMYATHRESRTGAEEFAEYGLSPCALSFVRVIEQGEGAEGRKILRTIRVGPDQGAIGHLVQHISVSDQQDEFLARDR